MNLRAMRGLVAYNAEKACRLLSMMVLDALGNIGNGSDCPAARS